MLRSCFSPISASPNVGVGDAARAGGLTLAALGLALTGMMRDHDITRDRAVELARMVLTELKKK